MVEMPVGRWIHSDCVLPASSMINYVPYVNVTVQYTHTYFFFHFDKIHTVFILYINKLVTDLFLCNFDACIIHILYTRFFKFLW